MHQFSKNIFRYGSIQQSPVVTNQQNIYRIQYLSQKLKVVWNYIKCHINLSIIFQFATTRKNLYLKMYLLFYLDQMLLLPILSQPMYYPSYKDLLRNLYNMNKQDQILKQVNKRFVEQCPLPKLKPLFKRLSYENKGVYAALSLINNNTFTNQQYQIVIQFLTAIQLVNLGFSLHYLIEKSSNEKFNYFNFLTRVTLKLKTKQIKDSILVLAGDYFHIKASVLASKTNIVQLSRLLSQLQVDLCKRVHLIGQLKTKIINQGYDKVKIQQIHNISILKISPIIKALTAIDIITGKSEEEIQKMQELYQIIGLLISYRKDLQNFMLNFKHILHQYQQSMKTRINCDTQQTLPYYIFYQGSQNNSRLDTSFINTDTLMKQKIKNLQNQLDRIIGKNNKNQIEKKIQYFLMISP